MMRRTRSTLVAMCGVLAMVLLGSSSAKAELALGEHDGWRLSIDGRANTFMSVAIGTGLPDGQPDFPGAGTNGIKDSAGNLHSTRIRNGFLTSILGFALQKDVSPNMRVTTRVGFWMNISGSRTQNISTVVDPRELYEEIEGGWGSVLAGRDMALFSRGGILMDSTIAHNYGLGYPCAVRDASGGACGMVAFGAPFPGFEAGVIYATPRLGGAQLSLGVYDPATIEKAQLTRAPLPRFEGEGTFAFKDKLKVFASGFWQVLEGTIGAQDPNDPARQKDLHVNAWGVQAGAMVALGPVMLGGAAYEGAGFSPITYIDESQIAGDSTGVLRNSRGAFGLGALLINTFNLKIAGGLGVWRVDKSKNDSGPVSATGSPTNPQLIKENLGATVGIYQDSGPVHFALEYFRAQHTWYDRGVANAMDPTVVDIVTPKQVVNFINAGMTVAW